MKASPRNNKAFTIVELLIVIVVIAILATVVIIGYNGLQNNARGASLLSDIDSVEAELARYATKNGGSYGATLNWDSSAGSNSNINFTPSSGNTVIVSIYGGSYCIKAFNPQSESKNINTAKKKGQCTLYWSSIVASFGHSCAISTVGDAYCWGDNGSGRLGNGTTLASSSPSAVVRSGQLLNKTVLKMDLGIASTCAVASDNNAYCWGANSYGGLGNASFTSSSSPVAVARSGALAGKTIKEVTTGEYHACAIASDDLPYCWGYNSHGQLGNGNTTNSSSPVAVLTSGALSGKTVKAIDAFGNTTCVIASDDLPYCWGFNNNGRLGDGTTVNSSSPVAVLTSGALSGKTVKSITGGNHTCAIDIIGASYCWSINTYGAYGNNTTTVSLVPLSISPQGALVGRTIKSISGGSWGTCAVGSDDRAYCWGLGTSGQLGNGASASSSIPVAVSVSGVLAGKAIRSISLGTYHACAVTTENAAFCWGQNTAGVLGNGLTTNSNVPVTVKSD